LSIPNPSTENIMGVKVWIKKKGKHTVIFASPHLISLLMRIRNAQVCILLSDGARTSKLAYSFLHQVQLVHLSCST
jgi:hypothetical protein